MMAEFSWQHLKDIPVSDENTRGMIVSSTTDGGYRKLIYSYSIEGRSYRMANGDGVGMDYTPVNLFIGTEPSPEHLAAAKQNEVTLVKKPVCTDAFVFIVNKNNPVNSLTIDQIQKIYSGEITNWKQVGGKEEEIKPYQRDEGSGSQTAMITKVMKGKELMEPRLELLEGLMGGLVARIADYDNGLSSIGYTYKYYIDQQYKNSDIKVIKINGIAPSDDNVRSKKYPFYDYYYGVIRKGDEKTSGGLFLDWMLSDEGQRCIKQAGYNPIKDVAN
jgi:phosphate transport system substrate-binding protein